MVNCLRGYDMRKLIPRFGSEDPHAMAFVGRVEGIYLPFYQSPEISIFPGNGEVIREASKEGLLFAYINPLAFKFVGEIADELNEDPTRNVKTLLEKKISEQK